MLPGLITAVAVRPSQVVNYEMGGTARKQMMV
jgi:hypothetical protein